jgi:hypothetical protein
MAQEWASGACPAQHEHSYRMWIFDPPLWDHRNHTSHLVVLPIPSPQIKSHIRHLQSRQKGASLTHPHGTWYLPVHPPLCTSPSSTVTRQSQMSLPREDFTAIYLRLYSEMQQSRNSGRGTWIWSSVSMTVLLEHCRVSRIWGWLMGSLLLDLVRVNQGEIKITRMR